MIQAIEANAPAAEAPKVETTVAAHTRKHTPHGRGELPAHLRREIEVVDVPAEQKVLPDGTERPVIGHEDAERLAYIPAEFFVKVTRRPKYGSPAGGEENGVVIAPVPEELIPRCLLDQYDHQQLAIRDTTAPTPFELTYDAAKAAIMKMAAQTGMPATPKGPTATAAPCGRL